MIPIYDAEASIDGLAEKILASQSIAYSSEIHPWSPTERELLQKQRLSQALKTAANMRGFSIGSASDRDLYFTKSILVSTNWNRNDDVFTPDEVWAARHTPSHKPTNLEHDETRLVGHITETWALDNDSNIIPDDIVVDKLPLFYHLANGAVIYTNWEDDDLIGRTNDLIGQIEAGKKFVSMEALFSNFSYAVVTPEKEQHVVARTQDTAFLTKHLRIYGGTGEFDGCKVGRLLRNITFCGKGYVDKPANPYSVIFKDAEPFNYVSASTENPFRRQSGVSIFCSSYSSDNQMEKESMSADTLSVDLLKSQNDKLENTVATLQSKVEELTKSSSEAGVKALESKVADLSTKLEATQQELSEAKTQVETLATEKESLEKELSETSEAKASLEKEVTEAKAAKVKADRISALVDGGVDREVAEKKVEVFAGLNDEQFETVAEALVQAAKDDKEDSKDKKDKKDKEDAKAGEEDLDQDEAEASADEEVVENAEPEDEAGLTADASDSEEDEMESVRAELRKALAHRLGKEVQETQDTE